MTGRVVTDELVAVVDRRAAAGQRASLLSPIVSDAVGTAVVLTDAALTDAALADAEDSAVLEERCSRGCNLYAARERQTCAQVRGVL